MSKFEIGLQRFLRFFIKSSLLPERSQTKHNNFGATPTEKLAENGQVLFCHPNLG
jgi:hypothetical protein